MQLHFSRRDFVKQAALTAGALPFLSTEVLARESATAQVPAAMPQILVFSKHLQFLSYPELADATADMGFDGIDLTVRGGGHVLPERVEDDLPKAVEAIKKAGLAPLMMTTTVEGGRDIDDRVLKTAASQGIKYYRMNWYKYSETESLPQSLEKYRRQVRDLSRQNKKLGLIGCYQNHAGMLVGASIWEIWEMLRDAEASHMGVQYDIRHATVEGGTSWQNGLRLIHPNIQILAIKDFLWEKDSKGVYKVKNVPLGEGMVDFKTYFGLLKKYQVQVPISLHFEYDLGGAEHGSRTPSVDQKAIYTAMRKDIKKLKELWQEA
ncbi:sugar phosphate isomerase/epimerase [Rhabdobacter roseus]|uniref:Sugar phosphate isomerase/epimerase n=1 Tax=Rhabdobacter roseus TaxID=1655419 RepID=A0A840TPK7_9BACT|nr:sugar phosphate isomerase/epimerase family protein [Rhabdobacter roseus]MBB5285284.1 sugar phosphate isomerase/epimerase [Rhabdobacter roseus]